ncbi:MAG: translation initiation factor IF-2 [Lacrimispora saccharolytica]
MPGKRVYELAGELNLSNKEVLDFLRSKNIDVKSHMSSLKENEEVMVRKALGSKEERKPVEKKETENREVQKRAGEETKAERPKKKNIISVVRPQNATSKEARDFAKNQGQKPARGSRPARPKSDRPQGDRPARAQGDRPAVSAQSAQSRPAGGNAGRTQNKEGRPQGDRPARPQNRDGRPAGNNTGRPQGDRPARPSGERNGERGSFSRGNGNGNGRPARPDRGPRPFNKDEDSSTRRPSSDGRRGQRGADGRKSAGADTIDLGIKKPGRDTGRKEKDKTKDDRRDNKFSDDRRSGNRPNQGHRQQSRIPKALQKPVNKPKQEAPKEVVKEITLPEKMTVRELAEKMKMQPSVIVKKLFMEGIMVTVNHEIDFEKAQEIALDYDIIAEPEEKVDVIEELLREEEEDESSLVPRPPVVCVMGHVDHGKTSLLDCIRHTNVTDREAGGITQHIGAYTVSVNGQKITFLDTPGHEAFTAMRMRGANATDIAILVVAADDGVMPQTIEAINHAKAAGVEIIVAINKIDKPGANVERVKQELSEYELIPEDWGGSTVFVPVSAKTHEGISDLLEMILLTSEVLELKANPKRRARGLVIEAQLDKGKGPVATILVQKGMLRVGDSIAAGACSGKVRAMMDDKGRRVKEAGPSTPVEILGLSDVPNAGEILVATETDKEAKNFAATFISENKKSLLEETKTKMSLDDLFSQIQEGNLKELGIIVKADVQGSVEAVKQSLVKLSNDEVVVRVIHGGVGAINESDVTLASASNAIIIGFNVRPDATAKSTAEQEGVDIRLYRVIYQAIEDVEAAMKGMLEPIYEEKVIGHAEVRQLFKASGVGTIAGSYVLDGVFQRGCKVRITREGTQIFEGALASLKRFKDDVKEVRSGYECGLVFEGFNDLQELDQVEAYIMVEVPR